ncbi:MAG: hypothetical protein RIE77_04990 [Phycisphaerales bacterium]|jgi:hypothetical protein
MVAKASDESRLLLCINGMNRVGALRVAADYIAGRWSNIPVPEGVGPEADRAWTGRDTCIHQTCARSFGPFGYVKLGLRCTSRRTAEELLHGRDWLAMCCRALPLRGLDHDPPVLNGSYFERHKTNLHVEVMRREEEFAFREGGHARFALTVPDRRLDLSRLCYACRDAGLDIRQEEGVKLAADAIHRLNDAEVYRHAFRVKNKDDDLDSAIEAIDRIVKELYGRAGLEHEVDRLHGATTRWFTSAYGNAGRAAPEEGARYGYLFAHVEDRLGLLGDLAQAADGLADDTANIVRSSCRSMLGTSTVLMCVEGVAAETGPFVRGTTAVHWGSAMPESTPHSEFAMLSNVGPWDRGDAKRVLLIQGRRPDEPGLMRSLLNSFDQATLEAVDEKAHFDIAEFDGWSGFPVEDERGAAAEPGITTFQVSARFWHDAAPRWLEDEQRRAVIQSRMRDTLRRSGWDDVDCTWAV